ncbi:hypothetical protein FD755_002427 [Muntiacus reevesi]|uniref:Clathrin light chain n=1 Tax=Muntiacus reevesi TaxID=9886 RepID=A0A5J5N446_MUNRE|nr:hypothetical protein FD755_002427 [Muntiacus reevesi]
MADDFGFFSSSESGAPEAAEEDPAAAFLAQQESEIAGIENDEGFGAPAGSQGGLAQPGPASGGSEDMGTTVNGDVFQEANGPADGYAAIAQADRLTQEPESIRKWREEQRKRLQELDAASKVMEQEWREKAKKDLEEWNQRQSEQVEKNKINNRIADKAFYQQPDADIIGYVRGEPLDPDSSPCWSASSTQNLTFSQAHTHIVMASEEAFVKESKEETPGTEWEKVAQLCDFNPKSSKQCKDVSRLRSVLMSLKQTPLSR